MSLPSGVGEGRREVPHYPNTFSALECSAPYHTEETMDTSAMALVVRFINLFTKNALFVMLLQIIQGGGYGTENNAGSTGARR